MGDATRAPEAPLRILVMHNRYQQAGGEDSVFANEVDLLRSAGCAVDTLVVSNDDIDGRASRVLTALRVVSNPEAHRLATRAIARFRPDVVHVHNFFPRLSPTVFDACTKAGVPAVWTLHNFRIACANGLLFRNGHPCEDCVGRAPFPAVAHSCYRESLPGSVAVAGMIGYHRAAGTWLHKVARFIVLSEFARTIVVRAGIPDSRIVVKPNFVPDPSLSLPPAGGARRGAVYVGRLSPEKGADVMVEAWRRLPHVPLTILGDGPDRERLEALAPANVRFAGFAPREVVLAAMREAEMLVMPSVWYEGFPMVIAEAMALGTPIAASRIGALESIVEDGVNGRHFTAGDSVDLAHVIDATFADGALLAALGAGAHRTWEATMRPETCLSQLLAIYEDVCYANIRGGAILA